MNCAGVWSWFEVYKHQHLVNRNILKKLTFCIGATQDKAVSYTVVFGFVSGLCWYHNQIFFKQWKMTWLYLIKEQGDYKSHFFNADQLTWQSDTKVICIWNLFCIFVLVTRRDTWGSLQYVWPGQKDRGTQESPSPSYVQILTAVTKMAACPWIFLSCVYSCRQKAMF